MFVENAVLEEVNTKSIGWEVLSLKIMHPFNLFHWENLFS